ncbi:MAG: dipicolinate synthase subunit DpsA [Clostridiales bacterium]|nr:dipicolinate synthase subunit DpsA [Clostridiales bacterium]MCF8022197.1 dipicolinate synthase subunit DpsA [Clostridiales bacterium]
MQPNLSGISLAILGGDYREVLLAEHLVKLSARVKVFGINIENKTIEQCSGLWETVENIDALILPVPGVSEDLKLYTPRYKESVYVDEELFSVISNRFPVLVGVAKTSLKNMAKKYNLRLIEVMNIDEVAILNSIPSAEGAVQRAMEKMLITIHGCNAVVCGFGRTAITLVRMLHALGANVTVLARDPAQIARAVEMGVNVEAYSKVKEIDKIDIIFNTVPALVLTREFLKSLLTAPLIIDIASAPGGTDFETAKELGFDAELIPGIPGKVAPETAGQILAQVVPKLLVEELTLR